MASPLGRAESTYVPFVIIDEPGEGTLTTYRAGYELITRRLRVMLEMFELYHERGSVAFGGGDFAPRPTVSDRVTYMTEAFASLLKSIRSIEDFGRYAPYRPDHQLALTVHPDDVGDAYLVLRELNIRLSASHHPDQHWWKDEA